MKRQLAAKLRTSIHGFFHCEGPKQFFVRLGVLNFSIAAVWSFVRLIVALVRHEWELLSLIFYIIVYAGLAVFSASFMD